MNGLSVTNSPDHEGNRTITMYTSRNWLGGSSTVWVTNEISRAIEAIHQTQLDGIPMVVFDAVRTLQAVEAMIIRDGVLGRGCLRSILPPIIDPLLIDRCLLSDRQGRETLHELAVHYDVEVPTDTGTAAAVAWDAETATKLARKMLHETNIACTIVYDQEAPLGRWVNATPEGLHQMQQKWLDDQGIDFPGV